LTAALGAQVTLEGEVARSHASSLSRACSSVEDVAMAFANVAGDRSEPKDVRDRARRIARDLLQRSDARCTD
jgi:hypothetical protein